MRRLIPVFAVVLAAASGCGFLNAVSHPPAPEPQSATGAPVTTTEAPPPPLVDADLQTSSGGPGGHLVVTLGRPRTGLAPPVPNAQDCSFDAPSLQFLPVEFATPPGLAAHVEIGPGPATPAGIGDVGVFVESNGGEQVYCTDSPPLPTRDKFWNQMGARTIHAWVVVEGAVTTATPQGRPEVFPTLQLRISRMRILSDPTGAGRSLKPGAIARGAVCPDDPGALCVPLG